MKWFVYIIKSTEKNWYYVGSTNRLEKRLGEHNNGMARSTKHYIPFNIIFTKEFNSENQARSYEQKLKDCRKEKERIVNDAKNI